MQAQYKVRYEILAIRMRHISMEKNEYLLAVAHTLSGLGRALRATATILHTQGGLKTNL